MASAHSRRDPSPIARQAGSALAGPSRDSVPAPRLSESAGPLAGAVYENAFQAVCGDSPLDFDRFTDERRAEDVSAFRGARHSRTGTLLPIAIARWLTAASGRPGRLERSTACLQISGLCESVRRYVGCLSSGGQLSIVLTRTHSRVMPLPLRRRRSRRRGRG
jgi:hypothetical protein